MRLFHVRHGKEIRVGDAVTFLAADRQHTDEAFAGDIIGLHNHGTINIGDTLTEGERIMFTGVPNFAPGAVPARGAARPAAHEGAAEGARPAVRGRRDAAVPAAAQQRPDSRRRRPAAVRRGRVPAAGRILACRPRWDAIGVYTARWVYCDDREEARRIPHQGLRQPRARSFRRARVSRADARQPAPDAGALARHHVPRNPRAPGRRARDDTRRS